MTSREPFAYTDPTDAFGHTLHISYVDASTYDGDLPVVALGITVPDDATDPDNPVVYVPIADVNRLTAAMLAAAGQAPAPQPETAPDATNGLAAVCPWWKCHLAEPHPRHIGCPGITGPETAPDAEPGTPDLREQYAALFRHAPSAERLGDQTPGEIADAVLAVRDDALTTAQRAAETAEHVARQNLDHYRRTYRDYQRLEAELVAARSEIDRLRTYATATDLRHTEIRDHLATLDIRTRSDAWSLGAHIIAILDSPPDDLTTALGACDDGGQDGGQR